MKHMTKVGCCLAVVASAVVFASPQASAKGIEGIFGTAESSGDHSLSPAKNAFLSSYWLAGNNFSTYSD